LTLRLRQRAWHRCRTGRNDTPFWEQHFSFTSDREQIGEGSIWIGRVVTMRGMGLLLTVDRNGERGEELRYPSLVDGLAQDQSLKACIVSNKARPSNSPAIDEPGHHEFKSDSRLRNDAPGIFEGQRMDVLAEDKRDLEFNRYGGSEGQPHGRF